MPGDPSARRTESSRTVIQELAYTSRDPSASTQPMVPYPGSVRLVIARCQVDYVGRLTAHLPMAQRVLMVKADGSVLVHSDGGSYKPLYPGLRHLSLFVSWARGALRGLTGRSLAKG